MVSPIVGSTLLRAITDAQTSATPPADDRKLIATTEDENGYPLAVIQLKPDEVVPAAAPSPLAATPIDETSPVSQPVPAPTKFDSNKNIPVIDNSLVDIASTLSVTIDKADGELVFNFAGALYEDVAKRMNVEGNYNYFKSDFAQRLLGQKDSSFEDYLSKSGVAPLAGFAGRVNNLKLRYEDIVYIGRALYAYPNFIGSNKKAAAALAYTAVTEILEGVATGTHPKLAAVQLRQTAAAIFLKSPEHAEALLAKATPLLDASTGALTSRKINKIGAEVVRNVKRIDGINISKIPTMGDPFVEGGKLPSTTYSYGQAVELVKTKRQVASARSDAARSRSAAETAEAKVKSMEEKTAAKSPWHGSVDAELGYQFIKKVPFNLDVNVSALWTVGKSKVKLGPQLGLSAGHRVNAFDKANTPISVPTAGSISIVPSLALKAVFADKFSVIAGSIKDITDSEGGPGVTLVYSGALSTALALTVGASVVRPVDWSKPIIKGTDPLVSGLAKLSLAVLTDGRSKGKGGLDISALYAPIVSLGSTKTVTHVVQAGFLARPFSEKLSLGLKLTGIFTPKAHSKKIVIDYNGGYDVGKFTFGFAGQHALHTVGDSLEDSFNNITIDTNTHDVGWSIGAKVSCQIYSNFALGLTLGGVVAKKGESDRAKATEAGPLGKLSGSWTF